MADCAVLVISCDKYSDLWKPFFHIFRKRWPDCPYKVYLGSNNKTYPDPSVTNLCVGEDKGWATSLRKMLDHVDSPYIIMLLEDFLLVADVDTAKVQKLVSTAVENKLGCLRLIPNPKPTRRIPGHPGLGIVQRGDEYRVSCQIAIWSVDMLRRLLRPQFSAWDFELIGSLVSDRLPGDFWSVYETVIDFRHGVEKGRWLPRGIEDCRQAGVEPDLNARPTMTEQEWRALRGNEIKRWLSKTLKPRWLRQFVRRRKRRPDVDALVAEIKRP